MGTQKKLEDIGQKTVMKYAYKENGIDAYRKERENSLKVLGKKNQERMREAAGMAFYRTSAEQSNLSKRRAELLNQDSKERKKPKMFQNKKKLSEVRQELNKLGDAQTRINMDIITSMIDSVSLDNLPQKTREAGMQYIAEVMGYIDFSD